MTSCSQLAKLTEYVVFPVTSVAITTYKFILINNVNVNLDKKIPWEHHRCSLVSRSSLIHQTSVNANELSADDETSQNKYLAHESVNTKDREILMQRKNIK